MIALSSLTDEELLKQVYLDKTRIVDPLTLELATRLEHALDELRKPAGKVLDVLGHYDTD